MVVCVFGGARALLLALLNHKNATFITVLLLSWPPSLLFVSNIILFYLNPAPTPSPLISIH